MSVIIAPVAWVVRLVWQTVFLALGQVWANKVRAVLTALGIIIGVASVIAVISFLDAGRKWILSELDSAVGSRTMWVWGQVPDSQEGVMNWSDVRVTTHEAVLLLEKAPSIESLTPLCQRGWQVGYGRETVRGASVWGVWPSWHEVESRQVTLGRPLTDIDNAERRPVCLINEQAITELKLDIDPVGDYLVLNGRRFLIVGVLETKSGGGIFGGSQPRTELYIPFNTHKMMDPYSGTWFQANMINANAADDAKAEVRFILRKNRGLSGDDEDTFGMDVIQNAIQMFNNFAFVVMVGAGVVVGISLFVGGIGIMNIMLVSVSERTREIGLRKSLGAQPPVVLLQFLVEAVVLCLVGGLIGLGVGFALTRVVMLMQDFPIKDVPVPGYAILIGLGFSASVGIVFGILPAIKAAMLNPIDALRHE
ncbi:MAG: ABC transporter permease [Phycisphaerales bacterium]|nr:ABC transporter permease [Phycisphaerales bacterium]